MEEQTPTASVSNSSLSEVHIDNLSINERTNHSGETLQGLPQRTNTSSRNKRARMDSEAGERNNSTHLQVPMVSIEDTSETERDKINIPTHIVPLWRQCRATISSATKFELRSAHFKELAEANTPPAWALGLGPMPPYLAPLSETITNLLRGQAQMLLHAVADSLTEKSSERQEIGMALKRSIEALYGEDKLGYTQCNNLLQELVNRDGSQEKVKLNNRKLDLIKNPITINEIQSRSLNKNRVTNTEATKVDD